MPICRDCGNNDAFVETTKCIDKVFYGGTHDIQDTKSLTCDGVDGQPIYCWRCDSSNVDVTRTEPTVNHILDKLADILYPMDGYQDDQWNGGDVCEALAVLLRGYRPEAEFRQPVRPLAVCGMQFETLLGVTHTCRRPDGHTGSHVGAGGAELSNG